MHRRTRILAKRGLRQCLLWLILPAIALVVLRTIWRFEATKRLNRARAVLLAAQPPSPTTQPGAPSIDHVLTGLWADRLPSPDDLKLLRGDDKDTRILNAKWTPAEEEYLKAMLDSCKPVFDRLDALQPHPVAPSSGAISFDGPPSASDHKVYDLTCLLEQAARISFKEHRHDATLRHLNQMHRLWRLARQASLSGSALRLEGTIAACAERVEPGLQLTDSKAQQEARLLISNLLELAPPHLGRNYWIYQALAADSAQLTDGYSGWWYAPYREDGIARYMERCAMVLPAFTALNYQEAKPLLRRFEGSHSPSKLVSLLDQLEQSVSDSPAVRFHLFQHAMRHALAMLFAARLHQARTGHFPSNAHQLVPEFLPLIPADPFAVKQVLRYRLDADGPTVWSVGDNGIDDGGATILFKRSGERVGRLNQPDFVYGARWRIAVSTSSASAPAP
jgi:hypothetical protein